MLTEVKGLDNLEPFQPQMFLNVDGAEKVLFDPGRVIVARDTDGKPYWLDCSLTQEFVDSINDGSSAPLILRWDEVDLSDLRPEDAPGRVRRLVASLSSLATSHT